MTSRYFRGVFAISANIFAGKKVKAPQVANVNNSPMVCPALTTPPINDDISIKYIHGTNDQVIPGAAHLVKWADGTTSWYYSQLEGVADYWSKVLGCTDHTTTKFGTPSAINVRDTFTACRRQYRGVELDEITGGNHGCPNKPGLDGFNGSDCRVEGWTFLSSH
jgi:poly(3-hydroxybutyrate) depolymerase